MDDKRQSPDSVDGPMLCNQKKDKICLVCGDKALGYNFNAVSCESCKAFFRRNAHKTIRGRCEGTCDINVESRSFCKKCRLAKCFTVGMRKDMILDDHQKKLRKQKILINKLRRHGTLPPEDTYAVTETDIQQSYTSINQQDLDSLRKRFPTLPESDIRTLYDAGHPEPPDTKKGIKCEYQSKLMKYQPWQDLDDSQEIVSTMTAEEKQVFEEMNSAHDNSQFLSNTQTRLKTLPKNPTEFFNIADGFVRRIIKVAKQLKFFREMDKDDQIALLKGSVVEIMMLRSAVNFDIRTETWTLSTLIKKQSDCSSNASSPCSAGSTSQPFDFSDDGGGIDINKLREAAMNGADLETLRNMAHGRIPSNMAQEKMPPHPMVPQNAASTNPEVNDSSMSVNLIKQKYGLSIDQMKLRFGSKVPSAAGDGANDLSDLRNAAAAAGFDVNALRQAAMNGASLDQLSQMAHASQGQGNPSVPDVVIKQETEEGPSNKPSEAPTLSSEILKQDRPSVENKDQVEGFQQMYACTLKKYIECRYSDEKNMFARCVMKLADLRNVNEIHTKMLLRMQVDDIEPLLVEVFDLPS